MGFPDDEATQVAMKTTESEFQTATVLMRINGVFMLLESLILFGFLVNALL
jgi:hypothetical protein